MIYMPRNFEWLIQLLRDNHMRQRADLERDYLTQLYDLKSDQERAVQDLRLERAEWLVNE